MLSFLNQWCSTLTADYTHWEKNMMPIPYALIERKDLNKWKDPVFISYMLNSVKIAILSILHLQLSCRINTIPIKICPERVNIAGLRMLSSEGPACRAGPWPGLGPRSGEGSHHPSWPEELLSKHGGWWWTLALSPGRRGFWYVLGRGCLLTSPQ